MTARARITARALHVPDTGIRGVFVPDSAVVMHHPAADSSPGPEHVSLTGRMELPFGDGTASIDFTISGWRAFIAAAKAGEFDGLVIDEAC